MTSIVDYAIREFTDQELEPIRLEVAAIAEDFKRAQINNTKRDGFLNHEYKLKDTIPYIEQLLMPMLMENIDRLPHMPRINKMFNVRPPLYLDVAWVNFMHKGEFHPPHLHAGVVSWSMWLEIPYTYEEEDALNLRVGHTMFSRAGRFEFYGVGHREEILYRPMKVQRNQVMMFPSDQTHAVNPFFSSDGVRISVSGNFRFLTK